MILAEISVIVPVLDDDEKLEVLLGALVEHVAEIIVVDGGSSKTVEQLCAGLGASYISSIASRGDQVAVSERSDGRSLQGRGRCR